MLQNNPAEARSMLLQNPQLAYALLQAQVVMRIIDPQTACVSIQINLSYIGWVAFISPKNEIIMPSCWLITTDVI